MAIFTVVTMNEELDPTLEIDNSGGEGLSEEDTAAAVENMQAAEQERAATQQQYAEQREQQLQEDLLCLTDGYLISELGYDDTAVSRKDFETKMCQIIIDNFKKLKT